MHAVHIYKRKCLSNTSSVPFLSIFLDEKTQVEAPTNFQLQQRKTKVLESGIDDFGRVFLLFPCPRHPNKNLLTKSMFGL